MVVVGIIITLIFAFLWARDVMSSKREEPEPEPEPEQPSAIGEPEPERYDRNAFLELTTLGLGGVITAVVALPVIGFAVLPAFTADDPTGVDIGPLDQYPEGDWRETTFLLDPATGEVSRRTAFVRYNGDVDGVPSMTLISNRCVHLGCPVQAGGPREEPETVKTTQAEMSITPIQPAGFSCPCHGGAYDTEGNRIAGPPVRALDRYTYSIVGGSVHLIAPYSVGSVEGEGADAQISAFQHQGPGEHVDGLSAFLYPIQPADFE